MSLLQPDVLIRILGSTLPQGEDTLASYNWRELPLYLLPSEMRMSDSSHGALLRCVKKAGGSYETFEDYMETYVTLLRENTFANMRSGLGNLMKGKLDSRDMRIFTGVELVAMSPPSSNSGSGGTVLELRTDRGLGKIGQPPMFGSLLALAPHGSFEQAVWATVAGTETAKGSLRIYAELCGRLRMNDTESGSLDSAIIADLLRGTGEISLAESPTFYRAYGPAISSLQSQREDRMPFFREIVLGQKGMQRPCLVGIQVNGSIAFKPQDSRHNAALSRMDAQEFVRALDYFSADIQARHHNRLFDGVPLVSTILDPSQCQALKSSLIRGITLVQGPPGCGKTFVGVRIAQLLLSMTKQVVANGAEEGDKVTADGTNETLSQADIRTADNQVEFNGDSMKLEPEAHSGPILVVTYKNVALDDFLGDCLKIWPKGVARVGGRPQTGSLLEHIHIKVLLRNTRNYRSSEYEYARRAVEDQRHRVEDAAKRLSQSRFFSADTLGSSTASDEARALLERLVTSDETDSKQEREQAMEEIQSQDPDITLSRAEKSLAGWLPTQKKVAELCRQPFSNERSNVPVSSKPHPNQSVNGGEYLDERVSDRNRYRHFEKTTVSLEAHPQQGRNELLVLQLKHTITEIVRHKLLNMQEVRKLDMADRVRLMHVLVVKQFEAALQAYDDAMQDYVHAVEQLHRHEIDEQVTLLRTMKVVGMTISGANISRDLIEKLCPHSVLVEEAAEVLEPLLVASLGTWVNRLILIGDNKQLPPQVETYSLSRDYNFDTSLMHRLIANNLPLIKLTSQSRMMPEFADLLKDVYPQLTTSNRVDVAMRPSPPAGFITSMWFWDLKSTEMLDPELRSYVNKTEVDAVQALVVHLLRSGIKPEQITVITPYTAQVELIRRAVRNAENVESESTWPTAEREGKAAVKRLDVLKQMLSSPRSDCIEVTDTFLKLGMLDNAQKAIDRAFASEAAEAEEVNLVVKKYKQRMRQMEEIKDAADNYSRGAGDCNEAIQSVKVLETLAAQWMVDCPSWTAAACHLQSTLAGKVCAALGKEKGNQKQKMFLEALKVRAETMLLDLCSNDKVCVSSIDRYQGSENDIVIISLVRTNGVGFLKERARRVVAQSRARLGMYFLGNSRNYCSIPHWRQLIASMQGRHRMGSSIQLCCANASHGGAIFNVNGEDTAGVIKQNPCKKPCGMRMGCGQHLCKLPCHGIGVNLHDASSCLEWVTDKCSNGHSLRRRCNVCIEDAVCITCERISEEERQREERAHKLLEESARSECDRLIRQIQEEAGGLIKKELGCQGQDLVEFLQVKDRTEKYVQSDHSSVRVTRIEKVINMDLELMFLKAKKELKSGSAKCNLQQLFHGTSREGLEGIPRTGFRLPDRRQDNMFGQGIYFAADSSKSAQKLYTKGSCCLLLCDVLIGKTCTVPGLDVKHPLSEHVKKSSNGRRFLDVDKEKMHRAGFDSVFAPRGNRNISGVRYDEMIVYDPSQAIPRYIIHFAPSNLRLNEWEVSGQTHDGVTVRQLRADQVGSKASKECEEFNIACGHFLRFLGDKRTANVTQVDVYDSLVVQQQYEQKKEEFKREKKPMGEEWVFHGTPKAENVQSICQRGFKIGGDDVTIAHGRLYGRGVYSATGPDTPMLYGSDAKSVILCKALPGKTGTREGDDSWKPHKDWMIFKTAEQLLPVYVVHF